MKFKGEIEITPKEIADLVKELQSQPNPNQSSAMRELLGLDDKEEKRVRGAKI